MAASLAGRVNDRERKTKSKKDPTAEGLAARSPLMKFARRWFTISGRAADEHSLNKANERAARTDANKLESNNPRRAPSGDHLIRIRVRGISFQLVVPPRSAVALLPSRICTNFLRVAPCRSCRRCRRCRLLVYPLALFCFFLSCDDEIVVWVSKLNLYVLFLTLEKETV